MGRPRGSKNVVPKAPQFACGPLYGNFVGSVVTRPNGYVCVVGVEGNGRHVPLHVIIVEIVIGRRLPGLACVHHVNEIKGDNRKNNLCVLQDSAEHVELHRKRRVQQAGGDPWTDRVCCWCRLPKPSTEFYFNDASKKYATSCIGCSRHYALKKRRAARVTDVHAVRLQQRRWYYANRYGIERDGRERT